MTLLSCYKPDKTGFFRHRRLAGGYLVTGDTGNFDFLTDREFKDFLSGCVKPGSAVHARLRDAGFLGGGADVTALAAKWRRKNSFLFGGPSLHIVVLTRRCNHACSYCQSGSSASRSGKADMTRPVADRVLDTIFSSPAPALTVEFQGGEPALNWPVLSYMVAAIENRAAKSGKKVIISLVSNLSVMTEARLDFLLKRNVRICTSLDGPQALHNANRPFPGGNSHAMAVKWLKAIKKRTRGGAHGDALVTVTRAALSRWKEMVDEYVKLGTTGIFIRFLNPFGAAKRVWASIGYSAAEYVAFYGKALDYIVELNLSGKSSIMEHSARILLTKILTQGDPNFLDLRSPCGAGIGQMAYDYDGSVFTCDEGRMLAAMGDEAFRIGAAGPGKYGGIMANPALKSVVTASVTDIQVSCASCAYKPYCGVCPVYNYAEHGDLFMHQPGYRCAVYMGMFDHVFKLLRNKKVRGLFEKWANSKPA
ncbi:MAG: His-Xaa-Ser system radical SAM maturase HxsB [Elusimicrobia bacterium RIFOXYA2_FULL_58_8]|nr:MAG: His-Xaa-Ser system radical SAM maturase HxsB [Elusimicrobia bacterium RIFOXYA12_FULL_57_11]OGS14519.1 MAG: His-Xaa-Ser system radical SAM maturase HxsB [Elusimicrobia bacterium RIFOXYA2_FULL_58_8]